MHTHRSRLFCLLFLIVIYAGCTGSPSQQSGQIPTQVILPTVSLVPTEILTETPTATESPIPSGTPSATESPLPSLTPSPDAALTQAAEIGATNAMLLETLHVVQTISVATFTLTPSNTPVPSATPTRMPSNTPDPVTAMTPSLFFTREEVRLHACASRLCETVARVSAGDAVMVTGRTSGEAVEVGNTTWYRTDYRGRQVYAYSDTLTSQPMPPATVPMSQPPTSASVFVSPLQTCPGMTFTCPSMTCEQAYACLAAGNKSLDRDGDGIPCESVCEG